jgi:epoxyqueuosine reductase
MNAQSLTDALRCEAFRLGFDLVGVTPAVPPPDLQRFEQWLADGYAGQMHYLADRLDAYRDPSHVLEGARSILMLGANYHTIEPSGATQSLDRSSRPETPQTPDRPPYARVSRYAWGEDYHKILRRRLRKLADFHRRLLPEAQVRGVVDTAPLFERHFGQMAGLGWIGKNTLLINEQFGSWFVLAALMTTAELEYDQPMLSDRCGSCRACLDACPTGALVGPHRLDARKCVSYLLMESHAPVPSNLRRACGDRLFGCDACQEACPWNRVTPCSTEPAFRPSPGMNPVALSELLAMDEAAFRVRFRHTPLWRAGYEAIRRNATRIAEDGSCRSCPF